MGRGQAAEYGEEVERFGFDTLPEEDDEPYEEDGRPLCRGLNHRMAGTVERPAASDHVSVHLTLSAPDGKPTTATMTQDLCARCAAEETSEWVAKGAAILNEPIPKPQPTVESAEPEATENPWGVSIYHGSPASEVIATFTTPEEALAYANEINESAVSTWATVHPLKG